MKTRLLFPVLAVICVNAMTLWLISVGSCRGQTHNGGGQGESCLTVQ